MVYYATYCTVIVVMAMSRQHRAVAYRGVSLTIRCRARHTAVIVNFTGRTNDFSRIRVRILLHSRTTCLTSLWGRYERSLVDFRCVPGLSTLFAPPIAWVLVLRVNGISTVVYV